MTYIPEDIIPPDWANWSASKPSVFQPLAGGLTNRSFLISTGNDRLVLRWNSAISDALDLDRRAEADVLQHADKAGLCAPLVYCDPVHRYLVTRFIAGEPWRRENDGAMRQLVQLLCSIHQLPPVGAHLDIEDKVASYWESIDSRAEFYPQLRALDAEMSQHIEAARHLAEGPRLCHNDLSPANLISTASGGLYAIDWEYAAMGDPFYDLAVIVEEHALNERERRLLLGEYLDREATGEDLRRLDHWRVIYGYLGVLWYGVRWCAGVRKGPESSNPIAGRTDRLRRLINAVSSR